MVRGVFIGGMLGMLGGMVLGAVLGWCGDIFYRWHDDGTPPWESVAEAFDAASAHPHASSFAGETGEGRW